METIFTYILKVNALLVLFYLVYQLALSSETFYKHSRGFLLSGLFVSLLLPFVTFTKIEYYEVKNSIDNQFFQAVSVTNEITQEPILTNQEILFLIYGIICFGFLIKTVFDFFKLFKIIRVSNPVKRDKLVYINTNLVHTPFSFFNYIVFNEELIHPIELENIIKHEEAHSKQKHSFDTLLAQFFTILFWFNPIVWLYRKSIVQNLEFLADSYAIQQVSDRTVYQKTMLKITTQASNITIINTFNQSSIKKRIIMLNTNQSNQKNIWKMAVILPIIAGFIYLFQVQVIAQEKKKTSVKQISKSFEDNVIYEITKMATTEQLNSICKAIELKYQLKATISNVKRNSANQIMGIKIAIKKSSEFSSINETESDEPIKSIYIHISKKNNKFEVAFLDSKKVAFASDYSNQAKDSEVVVDIEKNAVEFEKIIKTKTSIESKEDKVSISQTDVAPEPLNGIHKFRNYIAMKFKLPEVKSDVNDTIVAKFMVSKTGDISKITILKEGPKKLGLGDELTRILKESPIWKPGIKDGEPADLYFVLPVAIQIQSTK